MSKKIIAIALFAVMVLSLVPFANAADPAKLTGVSVIQLGTPTSGTKEAATYENNNLDETSGYNKEIKIFGNYDDLKKVEESDWSTVKAPKFNVEFTFGTEASDIYVNGSKVTLKDNKHVVEFVAQRGGNLSSYKIEVKKDGTTRVYDIVVRFTDDNKTKKVTKSMGLKVSGDNSSGQETSVSFTEDVLFVNYNEAVKPDATKKTVNLKFEFYADASTRIPAKDRVAKIVKDTDYYGTYTTSEGVTKNRFFVDENYSEKLIKNDEAFKMEVNPGVTSFKLKIEDENYYYETAKIPVVWNAVPANQITNVTILPGRLVNIAVGETVEFKISAAHTTALNTIKLKETNSAGLVYIDGLKVKGLKEGTAILTVYNGDPAVAGTKAIDSITVVVGAKAPVVTENQYRVLARKLNVRSGPGTNYPVVGSATQNQILTVVEVANGWAKLSNGTYASAQYLVQVTAATDGGAYKVTASSLNVRAAANGAKIGSLKKGTAVTVVSIADGWAQINYGGGVAYVSALYLAK